MFWLKTKVSASKVQFIGMGHGAVAAMSLRDASEPANYSMRRTGPDAATAEGNIADFAATVGFNRERLVMPRRWPHLGRVMVVDDDTVMPDPTGGLNPYLPVGDKPGFEHSCDGLITTQRDLCLGAQGADCPMLFLYDPNAKIVGAIHCGWKPVAQYIVATAVGLFKELGSQTTDIRAYVGPGAGDKSYIFTIDNNSKPLLKQNGRIAAFEQQLRPHPTRPGETVLRLNSLVVSDLLAAGLSGSMIVNDTRSCIENTSLHSYRRDGTDDMATSPHGLGIGVIHLA